MDRFLVDGLVTVVLERKLLRLLGENGGGAGIWPAVVQKDYNMNESGSSTKSFTPDTADMI